MSEPRFYITTPIYYVNASPHLGHSYTSVLCDAVRRFYDLMGYETYYLTGTDEHGENIMRVAREQGRSEQDLVDEVSASFRRMWPLLQVAPDDFIRTTERRHKLVVQAILEDLYQKGEIYKAEYEGVYCVQCERFYTDKEIDPTRPGVCPTHETELKRIREENYFFRMSQYQDWLREKIQNEPGFINPPQFANEVLGILQDPLEDLSISRPKSRLPWGIPFPFDPEHVVYVWFDALVNYMSALGYPGGVLFTRFWPAVNHVIAKDILRPHAVYWPTMLKAMGVECYQHLHVHGYWQSDGKKMSKTRSPAGAFPSRSNCRTSITRCCRTSTPRVRPCRRSWNACA
ncbi:MAG: class I tRNA ligase family protein [Candidatus Sumerlaeota bacterium]|nr:class I tRNA ligase family protein [Candidatus Sumerlaeota bacterium]